MVTKLFQKFAEMLRKGLGAFEMVTKTFVFEGNDYPLEKNLDFSNFFLSFVPNIKDKNKGVFAMNLTH